MPDNPTTCPRCALPLERGACPRCGTEGASSSEAIDEARRKLEETRERLGAWRERLSKRLDEFQKKRDLLSAAEARRAARAPTVPLVGDDAPSGTGWPDEEPGRPGSLDPTVRLDRAPAGSPFGETAVAAPFGDEAAPESPFAGAGPAAEEPAAEGSGAPAGETPGPRADRVDPWTATAVDEAPAGARPEPDAGTRAIEAPLAAVRPGAREPRPAPSWTAATAALADAAPVQAPTLPRRAASLLLDLLLLLVLPAAVITLPAIWLGLPDSASAVWREHAGLLLAVAIAVFVLLEVAWLGSFGRTPGLRLAGLRVVDETGGVPSYGAALLRALSLPIVLLPGVEAASRTRTVSER